MCVGKGIVELICWPKLELPRYRYGLWTIGHGQLESAPLFLTINIEMELHILLPRTICSNACVYYFHANDCMKEVDLPHASTWKTNSSLQLKYTQT